MQMLTLPKSPPVTNGRVPTNTPKLRVIVAGDRSDVQACLRPGAMGDFVEVIGVARNVEDLLSDASELKPDAVVVSAELEGYRPELIHDLTSTRGHALLIIGLVREHDHARAEAMRRQGAAAIYTTPLTSEVLHRIATELPGLAHARMAQPAAIATAPGAGMSARPSRPRETGTKPKLVTLWTAKGGDGKTLLTSNLGTLLAVIGEQRVLIIDNDMNGGRVCLHFDVEPKENTLYYLAVDYHANGKRLDAATLRRRVVSIEHVFTHLPKRGQGQLDLLSGITDIGHSTSPELSGPAGQQLMQALLATARELYDIVLVDTGSHPRLGTHAGALSEADRILFLNSTDRTSLVPNQQVFEALLRTFKLPRERFRLVINRYSELDLVNLNDVRNYMGLAVSVVIPEDTSRSVMSALNRGTPFVLAHLLKAKRSRPATLTFEGLLDLAEELCPDIRAALKERLREEKGWRLFHRS